MSDFIAVNHRDHVILSSGIALSFLENSSTFAFLVPQAITEATGTAVTQNHLRGNNTIRCFVCAAQFVSNCEVFLIFI